jgi:MiaB/RimO family radical SAM methylthiotransferase
MKAYVDCVGCEQRQMDAERVRFYLQANGIELSSRPDDVDILVLVSCAVDERNEADSLEAIRRLNSLKRASARLFVGGCLPSISPAKLGQLNIAGTFSPRSIDDLDELLRPHITIHMRDIADPNTTIYDAPATRATQPMSARSEYDRAKRGFKIRLNHGCLLGCSYCVIRNATGRLQSMPVDGVIAAFSQAVERGEPTIMLMGGDTGAFGLDVGSSFAILLERLLAYHGEHRVFIHDFNVNWLLRDMPEYARILRQSVTLRAMCLPIQSGSDAVLKKMRRPYKSSDVIRALRWIKLNAPHVALGTHIIAGFPGETDADFEMSKDLLRQVNFDFVTCFRYSEHPTAPSARIEPKVSEDVKVERLTQLRRLLGERATVLE